MKNFDMIMLFFTLCIVIIFNFVSEYVVLLKYDELDSEEFHEEKFRMIGEFILLILLFVIYAVFYHVEMFNFLIEYLAYMLYVLIIYESALIARNLNKLNVWTPSKLWKKGLKVCSEKIDLCVDKIEEMDKLDKIEKMEEKK